MTPLNADSTGNGTRMRLLSVFPVGTADAPLAIANSHRPLRFIQSLRTICGRGYSEWTLLGATSLAQRVMRGPLAGCQSAARAGPRVSGISSSERNIWRTAALLRRGSAVGRRTL